MYFGAEHLIGFFTVVPSAQWYSYLGGGEGGERKGERREGGRGEREGEGEGRREEGDGRGRERREEGEERGRREERGRGGEREGRRERKQKEQGVKGDMTFDQYLALSATIGTQKPTNSTPPEMITCS